MIARRVEDAGYVLTAGIIKKCLWVAQGFHQSRIVETAISDQRRSESASGTKELQEKVVFENLVQSKVLMGRFTYDTHDIDTLEPLRQGRMQEEDFRARPKSASMNFKSIRGTKSSPAWYHPNPKAWARGFFDQGFLREASVGKNWENGERYSWYAVFLPTNVALAVKPCGSSDTFLVLGCHEASSVQLWPLAQCGCARDIEFYVPSTGADAKGKTMYIFSLELQACQLKWIEPQQQRLEYNIPDSWRGGKAALRLAQIGAWEPFMVSAARRAFDKCTFHQLRKLMLLEKIGEEKTATSFPDLLEKCIMHYCPSFEALELYDTMMLREPPTPETLEQLYGIEEFKEFVDSKDWEGVDKDQKKLEKQNEGVNTYWKLLDKKKRFVEGLLPGIGKVEGSRRAQSRSCWLRR